MKTKKQLNRIAVFHKLIKSGKSGTPDEIAKRLGISRSRFFDILEDLKICGFPIAYSRKERSYYYTMPCKLHVDFSVRLYVNGKCIYL